MKTHLIYVVLMLFALLQHPVQWTAPVSADAVKNPLAGNAQATLEGGKTFSKQCLMCHGSKGMGDGPVSVNLVPKPGNLLLPKLQKLTDGAIFWKITNGKAPMPSFKTALSDQQRWQLVDYIRNLDKQYSKH